MSIDCKIITDHLPEFLRSKDLVRIGLYKSRSDVCWATKRGTSPPFIRLSPHKMVFPRALLCAWLQEKLSEGEVSDVKP